MPEFVIVAEHSAELCPTSNAKIRALMKQGSKEIPELAKKLGIDIKTLRVLGPDHELISVVEGPTIDVIRDFVMQSRLIQWNTVTVRASWSMEEALGQADLLPTLF
jgi:hypothetical protein